MPMVHPIPCPPLGKNEPASRVAALEGKPGDFLPDGVKPPGWDQSNNVPDVCKSIDPKSIPQGTIYLTQVGKTPNVLDESGEPFTTGPLIDQNGLYTRYEILTNETMFNFILDNNLYSKKGQKQFNADVDFTASDSKTGQVGSIMLKASWIKMGGKFDATNYYTTYALVYNNPEEQHGVKPACALEQVGLVGFHIAHKTTGEPQWIWSTFEHVANAPTQGESASLSAYNFTMLNVLTAKSMNHQHARGIRQIRTLNQLKWNASFLLLPTLKP